jgi:hypothetical protein
LGKSVWVGNIHPVFAAVATNSGIEDLAERVRRVVRSKTQKPDFSVSVFDDLPCSPSFVLLVQDESFVDKMGQPCSCSDPQASISCTQETADEQ